MSAAELNGIYYQLHPHLPETNFNGVVVLTHGILEHSKRYLEFIQKLNENGFSVYRYDLRGYLFLFGLTSDER